ncbi:MarR family winged helix-turn-helix transcriptional regulator [Reyranella soli]|jgi:DNA-binding MarR family transcriptional regulator|uniref:MarR family transcriptional regulator n=1 Tax=Reyranella soli TaxID=1230389 RepID=A0A512NN59_9HYPH|nr:MarR family winged helix-turn-helix transcriptional regulator [Reyranella soli]GEP60384.1 MarR family transcriptional regulator [Reyranella soli]
MAIEDCNCMSLRKAARRISNFYDAMLSPTGLRATQYSILALLNELGIVSINVLAERLDLDRTTTGKNMRPLAFAKLIKIRPSPTDGRSRVVQLTQHGAATLKAARPHWQKAQREFESDNGERLARNLRRTLSTLRVRAEPGKQGEAKTRLQHGGRLPMA